MLISDFGEVPESLLFLGVGTVSMNMLTSWSMWALVLLFFLGTVSKKYSHVRLRRGSGIFVGLLFWDCLKKYAYAHFVAYGLWCF